MDTLRKVNDEQYAHSDVVVFEPRMRAIVIDESLPVIRPKACADTIV